MPDFRFGIDPDITRPLPQRIRRKAAITCALFLVGCASRNAPPAGSVATAWQQRDSTPAPPPTEYRPRAQADVPKPVGEPTTLDAPIAFVDGQPIARNQVVDLLLRSRGAGVLEQLMGLELAERAATKKGLSATQSDVDFEFDLALRRLPIPCHH